MLLMGVLLVSGVAYAMQGEQEEKRGDADRDADSVREWLLEGVEVIEMEQLAQSRIENLFLADWHRKILKEYKPEMVSDALTQLEHLEDFQALANSQTAGLPNTQLDSQLDNRQAERESGAARAQLERACMIALLSKLGHAEKRVAEDKNEQRWHAGFRVERYICWIAVLGIPSIFIGALWPVVRCGS
jgi:hypothetical protein